MMNCCHNVPDWSLPNVLLDSGIFPVHRKCWRNISDASIIPAAINCSSVASLEHDMSTPSRKLSFLKSISDEVSVGTMSLDITFPSIRKSSMKRSSSSNKCF
ncbi:hypothetical protein KIW84_070603 [Lathyrus oleraceus]|uniref:Uncharacterized protein n=1 Tax=Pisum sativum TaxID=3888 RepID=A0A9D4ZSF8_PEA|nr:hypothetical protein KIW84_070603 [Pisum sativum]